jgi:hypothetical protein
LPCQYAPGSLPGSTIYEDSKLFDREIQKNQPSDASCELITDS